LYKIPASTLFLGKNLLFMPECHSTNSWALEVCQQSCPPEGTLVITNRQISGRGQRGNKWEAEPGMNLTFSLIFKPTFLAIKDQFLLSIVASLAIRDYLADLLNKTVQIKWPNDILVNEFKICGILIENQLAGDRITSAVIGIGLNVNQIDFSSPTATSIARIAGSTNDLQNVLDGLLAAIEARYFQLRQSKVAQLRSDYLAYLYRRHVISSFRGEGREFTGEISGVDEYGKLQVLVHGKEETFDIKEIAFADFNPTNAK
jgi:BirA family transcriptional regulator, biotin operon repressor / biotin---[acetyl-CoA-carboxylase] ligase